MRIAIIPTGRMEWEALHHCLDKLFPGHVFYCVPTSEEMATKKDIDFPCHSFTSCDVTKLAGKANNADKLLERAVAEALGDGKRQRERADLALIVDDLELFNVHQPAEVCAIMREAVARHLAALAHNQATRLRHAESLRTRVSFHVVKPMIESWLFADPKGPGHAGVPAVRNPRLQPGIDPECFQTDDPVYDADAGAACTSTKCVMMRALRASRIDWIVGSRNRSKLLCQQAGGPESLASDRSDSCELRCFVEPNKVGYEVLDNEIGCPALEFG